LAGALHWRGRLCFEDPSDWQSQVAASMEPLNS
jgi:hypothetical protein